MEKSYQRGARQREGTLGLTTSTKNPDNIDSVFAQYMLAGKFIFSMDML
jgi:hypothetical protein